jgi:hypothetical protein
VIAISKGKTKNPASNAMTSSAIFAVRLRHVSSFNRWVFGGVIFDWTLAVAERTAHIILSFISSFAKKK